MPYIDKDKLEQYAEKVFDRLNYFNDYTLRTIGRRIKGIGKLSAHDQQALKNMADISGDMKAITKKLAEITEMNIRDVENIYTQTVTDGVNSYKPLYDFKGMELVPFEKNEFAQQLVKHWFSETSGEMVNLSRTKALCFDKYNLRGEVIGSTPLEGAFQKAIDDAVTAISSGTANFNTAMRETVRNLGGSGVKADYGNGVTRELSGVIRQNLLYGAKQAALAYDEYINAELDCNGYEIDFHPFPRKSHEVIQGLIVAKGDNDITVNGVTYPSENKDLGEGKSAAELLNDYGCLHFKTSFMLGISIPRYDKTWLEKQRANDRKLIECNGIKKTGFQWKQVQRRIERSVRKLSDIRSMAEACGDNVLVSDCDTKIKSYREKYDDMCKKVGLTPKPERMAVYQGNSVKTVDNSSKSGIIKEQGGRIMSINNIDSPIEQRNTAKGNPNAILQIGRPLNNRQQKLLECLPGYDSRTTVNKKSVSMADLSALTALTGDEFALFTKGNERLVIRGNANSVNIDVPQAVELSKQGYKWSGHTHPGVDFLSMEISGGDISIWECFIQNNIAIYNSKGKYRIYMR